MKRLFRSRKEKLIGGVCGGIANYLAVDPVVVRIFFLILFFLKGIGLISYIIFWVLVPEEGSAQTHRVEVNDDIPSSENGSYKQTTGSDSGNGSKIAGIVLIVLGVLFLLERLDFLHNIFWWVSDLLSIFLVPGIVIGAGLLLILRNRQEKETEESSGFNKQTEEPESSNAKYENTDSEEDTATTTTNEEKSI